LSKCNDFTSALWLVVAVLGSVSVGSRAVPTELYSPNSETTVSYVQTGSPQPSGFAVNVGVSMSYCLLVALCYLACILLCFMYSPMPSSMGLYLIKSIKSGTKFVVCFYWYLEPDLLFWLYNAT